MDVQIFGLKKSSETRAALRFFAERRIKTHFVDFTVRGPVKGELQRFAQKFGAPALIDRECRRFAELGWASARYSDEAWLERLVLEPGVLRLPLVRWQHQVTVGAAEPTWKTWLQAAP